MELCGCAKISGYRPLSSASSTDLGSDQFLAVEVFFGGMPSIALRGSLGNRRSNAGVEQELLRVLSTDADDEIVI